MLRTVIVHYSQCMTELLMLCFKQENYNFPSFSNVPELKTTIGTRNTAFYEVAVKESIFCFAVALIKPSDLTYENITIIINNTKDFLC